MHVYVHRVEKDESTPNIIHFRGRAQLFRGWSRLVHLLIWTSPLRVKVAHSLSTSIRFCESFYWCNAASTRNEIKPTRRPMRFSFTFFFFSLSLLLVFSSCLLFHSAPFSLLWVLLEFYYINADVFIRPIKRSYRELISPYRALFRHLSSKRFQRRKFLHVAGEIFQYDAHGICPR